MDEELFYHPDQITPEEGELEIVELTAEPYPDMRRIRVAFRLSGFRKSLGSTVTLTDAGGEELTSANIVNMFIPQHEVTLHLPESRTDPGDYHLTVTLFTLQEIESEVEPGKVGAIHSNPLDSRTVSFTLK